MRSGGVDIRLRSPSAELLDLPWSTPLADWDATAVPFHDVPVGPSRHLVRFLDVGGGLLAVKEAPDRIVRREYDVLRALEARRLPAVRPVGMVLRGEERQGLLVTRFLERSWQYRRLFMRLPPQETKQRGRLLTAMAGLLVELHRGGVFWGDCSLANTLFVRDGQNLQAHLVDAETSEVHDALTDGQRCHDLEILEENVAGGLLDIACRLGIAEDVDEYDEAARSVVATYHELWAELHRDLTVGVDERWRVASHLHRLNELGYAVDEVRLEHDEEAGDRLRVKVAVAGRDHHAEVLRTWTGIAVAEGQAAILLNDAQAFASRSGMQSDERAAGANWRKEVFEPGMALVQDIGGGYTDPIQAFCDLLEVRWLLSEEAGRDVGANVALSALRERKIPRDAAASMSILEPPTDELPIGP